MKKKSKVRKHFRRYKPLYIFIFIELLMVLFFVQIWYNAKPLSEHDLSYATIVVDDVRYVSGNKISRLIVSASSQKYHFPNCGKISNSKLSDMIKVGDELSITYYTKDRLFSTTNQVVDAYTQSQVLRTTEEYIKSYDGVRVIETVVFIIIEILYFAASGFYLYICNVIKIKRRKSRVHRKNRGASKKTMHSQII